jgi:hypothetical protein
LANKLVKFAGTLRLLTALGLDKTQNTTLIVAENPCFWLLFLRVIILFFEFFGAATDLSFGTEWVNLWVHAAEIATQVVVNALLQDILKVLHVQ